MTDVLVVGDANPDLILSGDVIPRFGQVEQLLDGADLVIGGSGGILAHGLARLGRSTRLVAATGSDTLGDLMRQLLSAAGVDTSALLRQSDQSTGITVVLTGPDDRAVLTHLGAIPLLSRADVQTALDRAVLDRAEHLHVASYFLLGELAPELVGLLEDARSRGLTTSLDTNFDPAERWDGVVDLLPHLDLLLPNRQEALGLAHRLTGAVPVDVETAAASLAAAGPLVVVKDGADGAVSVDPAGQRPSRGGHSRSSRSTPPVPATPSTRRTSTRSCAVSTRRSACAVPASPEPSPPRPWAAPAASRPSTSSHHPEGTPMSYVSTEIESQPDSWRRALELLPVRESPRCRARGSASR